MPRGKERLLTLITSLVVAHILFLHSRVSRFPCGLRPVGLPALGFALACGGTEGPRSSAHLVLGTKCVVLPQYSTDQSGCPEAEAEVSQIVLQAFSVSRVLDAQRYRDALPWSQNGVFAFVGQQESMNRAR